MGSRPSPGPPNLVVRVRTLAPHSLSGRIDAHGMKIELHIARSLADSMLVLQHRDAQEALPLLTITDPGGTPHLALEEKPGRVLCRSQRRPPSIGRQHAMAKPYGVPAFAGTAKSCG